MPIKNLFRQSGKQLDLSLWTAVRLDVPKYPPVVSPWRDASHLVRCLGPRPNGAHLAKRVPSEPHQPGNTYWYSGKPREKHPYLLDPAEAAGEPVLPGIAELLTDEELYPPSEVPPDAPGTPASPVKTEVAPTLPAPSKKPRKGLKGRPVSDNPWTPERKNREAREKRALAKAQRLAKRAELREKIRLRTLELDGTSPEPAQNAPDATLRATKTEGPELPRTPRQKRAGEAPRDFFTVTARMANTVTKVTTTGLVYDKASFKPAKHIRKSV